VLCFLGSIPDISELSILLVSRGAIPGIHGGELLRREMIRQKEDGDNAAAFLFECQRASCFVTASLS
jgi:hypothetical protein